MKSWKSRRLNEKVQDLSPPRLVESKLNERFARCLGMNSSLSEINPITAIFPKIYPRSERNNTPWRKIAFLRCLIHWINFRPRNENVKCKLGSFSFFFFYLSIGEREKRKGSRPREGKTLFISNENFVFSRLRKKKKKKSGDDKGSRTKRIPCHASGRYLAAVGNSRRPRHARSCGPFVHVKRGA